MKFLASRELGRLAKWLRILGFDTVYFRTGNKSSLIITALREDRVVLTRNKILANNRALKILFIKSQDVKSQLREVSKGLDVRFNPQDMFTRCIVCNQSLASVGKEEIRDRIPEYIFQTQNEFSRCSECGRIYWQGTHWGNVSQIIKEVNSLTK